MGYEFTKEQQSVIDLRDRNLLVSAAAGSGKTMVLVERIISRLTKENPPLDVDKLLVVTFTKAAAAEMKERIRDAIEAALEQDPHNEHLQRQATLVHQAKITTIDSFCSSVIRDYFHTIDLDPGFRAAEEGELVLLQSDVLNDVLETWYQKNEEAFFYLVDCLAGKKNDNKMEEIILNLYHNSRTHPNPNAWLDSCVRYYSIATIEDLEHTDFMKELVRQTQNSFRSIEATIEYAKAICKEDNENHPYMENFDEDWKAIQLLREADTYGEMYRRLSANQFAKLKGKNKQCSEETAKMLKDLRDAYKKEVDRIRERYFYEEPARILATMHAAKDKIETLVEVVKDFSESFQERKRSKNIIDFSDMEHYALKILLREENGEFVATPAAKEYREKFAEIMVDEYQDSNDLQEEILTAISTVSEGKHNIFMVGDVKQSIYQFRLARPELFMDKYEHYTSYDSKDQKIDLHKNFRSRKEVLDSTNYIFRQIMTKDFGKIEYDKKAELDFGADYYPPCENNETEVLLIDVSEKDEELTVVEREALAVAQKIKELVGKHLVYNKKTRQCEPAKYSDIVILTRVLKEWADVFVRVLRDEGIPAYSQGKSGYFDAKEIRLLLDYLSVIDNPRQDVPLTAVLKSCFAEITEEELAVIKSSVKAEHFYECVFSYADTGSDEMLKEKLQRFLTQLEGFREKVPYTAIHNMIWDILDKTGYGYYVASLPAGEQRTANLEMLIEQAINFESTSYKGLFHFVRYIEGLKKLKTDYGEANILDESADVVNILSIHKSKGLEFPIVFAVGMGKKFNGLENRDKVVLHSQLGIGIDLVDMESREKIPLLMNKIIRNENVKETVAEQLRMLYVAMTRAKEKLILTGTVQDLEKKLKEYGRLRGDEQPQLPYAYISEATSYLDWILPALYRNKVMAPVFELFQMEQPWQNNRYSENIPMKVQVIQPLDMVSTAMDEELTDAVQKDDLQNWDTETVYDAAFKDELEKQFEFHYEYEEEISIKQKKSVSELKKQVYLEAEEIQEETVIPLLPKFMQEETIFSGVVRGTAYHRVLELLDFAKDYDEKTIATAIQNMVNRHLLTEEMADCVSEKIILGFLKSSVGNRMKTASRNNTLRVEQPFVLGEEQEGEPMTLVQGIIDVYFEEDGELVVLDYKTDRVSSVDELVSRYHVQLDYYAKVLEQVTGKRVKEKMIYSFALKQEIPL